MPEMIDLLHTVTDNSNGCFIRTGYHTGNMVTGQFFTLATQSAAAKKERKNYMQATMKRIRPVTKK